MAARTSYFTSIFVLMWLKLTTQFNVVLVHSVARRLKKLTVLKSRWANLFIL
jgi:hypothetical protein